MDELEKLERLVAITGVSYEDARDALKENEYDLIEAIVYLERQGKTEAKTATFTTDGTGNTYPSQEMSQAQLDYEQTSSEAVFSVEKFLKRCIKSLWALWLKFWSKTKSMAFVAEHKGQRVLKVPLLLLLILMLLAFYVVLPLLVAGLFFGYQYHFVGVGPVTFDVNEMSHRASDMALNFKQELMQDRETHAVEEDTNFVDDKS